MKRDPKKLIFLAAIVAVFLFFMMGGANRYRQFIRRTPPPASVKPSPSGRGRKTIQRLPGPSEIAKGLTEGDPSVDMSLAKRAGNWTGTSTIINRGNCDLRLELHQDSPDANKFQAFTTLRCTPLWQFDKPTTTKQEVLKDIYRGNSPTSATFSGQIVGHAIVLNAENIIDAAGDGCVMKVFYVAPFGNGKVAVRWDDTPCTGGQMILQRQR